VYVKVLKITVNVNTGALFSLAVKLLERCTI
jgi:hypothetical protein